MDRKREGSMGRRERLRRFLCRMFGHVPYREFRTERYGTEPDGYWRWHGTYKVVCARCGKPKPVKSVVDIYGGGRRW